MHPPTDLQKHGPPHTPWRINTELILVCSMTMFAAGMRSWNLDAGTITFDEAFSWRLCQSPFRQILESTAADVHPPLYYLLLRAWCLAVGFNIFQLRLFSVLCGALEIAVVYFWTKRCVLFEATASVQRLREARFLATWAAFVIAVHPAHVLAGRTARMYALGSLLAALSGLLLLNALSQRTPTAKRWLLYAVAAIGFAYTHNYAWFTLAAQWLLGFARSAIPATRIGMLLWNARWSLLAPALILLAYAPWLPTFYAQVAEVSKDYWIASIGQINLPSLVASWAIGSEQPSTVVQFTCLAAVILIIVRAISVRNWLRIFLFSQFVAPWILGIGLSVLMGQGIVVLRYLLFAHVTLVVCAAVVLRDVRLGIARYAIMVGVGLSLSIQTHTEMNSWYCHNTALHRATTLVQQSYTSGDWIICSDPGILNKAKYLFEANGFRQPIMLSPASIDYTGHHVPHMAALRTADVPTGTMEQHVQELKRVWYISRWPGKNVTISGMRVANQIVEFRNPEDNVVLSLFQKVEALDH